MDIAERVQTLKKIDLFNYFSDPELEGIARKIEEISLEYGEILFREGEAGNDMYVLLAGKLKVFKESRIITEISPIDYVGEMAIIETKPRSATIQALERSRLFRITYSQFEDYLSMQPQSLVSMMKTLSQRIRRDTETLAEEFEKANIMIHDMKNILSVFLYLESLRRECPSTDAGKYIDYMSGARNNLAAMMEEALANAKRMSFQPKFTTVSLPDLINSLLETEVQIIPALSDKNVELSVNGEIPDITLCPLDIKRVLINLLINAAHASKSGDTIKVVLENQDNTVAVSVIDQGQGITPEIADKIFLPHFTTKEDGNGLGLPSCKRIIEERHGGILRCSSKVGEGACFEFSLPYNQAAPGAA